MKHQWSKCNCNKYNCVICEGNLSICAVCGAAEGELTTECPGVKMTPDQKKGAYTGNLDYYNGEWTRKTWRCSCGRENKIAREYCWFCGYRN